MLVREILAHKGRVVHTCSPTDSLADVVDLLVGHNIGSLVVVENEQMVTQAVPMVDIAAAAGALRIDLGFHLLDEDPVANGLGGVDLALAAGEPGFQAADPAEQITRSGKPRRHTGRVFQKKVSFDQFHAHGIYPALKSRPLNTRLLQESDKTSNSFSAFQASGGFGLRCWIISSRTMQIAPMVMKLSAKLKTAKDQVSV